LDRGFRCDALGCIARLADGKLVAAATSADAFEEDCREAALVVTARNAPPACAATIIDRNAAHARGAMALRRKGEGWEITAARPAGQDRPWARGVATTEETTTAAARQQTPTRDATPRPEDLEAGD
jgi:competence protein ComEC